MLIDLSVQLVFVLMCWLKETEWLLSQFLSVEALLTPSGV